MSIMYMLKLSGIEPRPIAIQNKLPSCNTKPSLYNALCFITILADGNGRKLICPLCVMLNCRESNHARSQFRASFHLEIQNLHFITHSASLRSQQTIYRENGGKLICPLSNLWREINRPVQCLPFIRQKTSTELSSIFSYKV